jgi:hypothetical protein
MTGQKDSHRFRCSLPSAVLCYRTSATSMWKTCAFGYLETVLASSGQSCIHAVTIRTPQRALQWNEGTSSVYLRRASSRSMKSNIVCTVPVGSTIFASRIDIRFQLSSGNATKVLLAFLATIIVSSHQGTRDDLRCANRASSRKAPVRPSTGSEVAAPATGPTPLVRRD